MIDREFLMSIQFKTKSSFGIFKTIFRIVSFALLSLIVTPVFACVTPPAEKLRGPCDCLF